MNAQSLAVTVDRLDKNLQHAERQLLDKGKLPDSDAAQLMLFRERTDALKRSLAAEGRDEVELPVKDESKIAQAENLEQAFEAWVHQIDEEFTTPTKRVQSTSM